MEEVTVTATETKKVPYRMAPIIRLMIVKEGKTPVPRKALTYPAAVAELLKEKYGDCDRELMGVIHLDTRTKVIAVEVISMGDLNTLRIDMREVFKGAILSNAKCIILFHNHPSGEVMPSAEDISTTRDVKTAGQILGIELLDHIVLSSEGWTSLKERCLM